MSVTFTYPASPSHRSGNEDTHAVMYWVKRPAYELALAVPQASHAGARGARPRVCVRVKTPVPGQKLHSRDAGGRAILRRPTADDRVHTERTQESRGVNTLKGSTCSPCTPLCRIDTLARS